MLWSCLADRLPWATGEAEFQIEFAGEWSGEPAETLTLSWDAATARFGSAGVPEKTITELAGCAIAMVLCAASLSATVERLATDGDRFDYWLWWEDGWYGLEVSGTLVEDRGDLRQRQREKVAQLLGNPFGLGGVTVVTNFLTRTVLFSAHLGEREVLDATA